MPRIGFIRRSIDPDTARYVCDETVEVTGTKPIYDE